jgi:hypothetical protein
MTSTLTTAVTAARAPRRLEVVPTVRRSDAHDRRTAIRRVVEARQQLQRRSDRFAYLKAMYD